MLETLGCSIALSRRPSGVAILGATDGKPTLSACLLPRSMGMAYAGNRLAVAGAKQLLLFANVKGLAPLYPKQPDHYDAMFVPRQSFYTGYCDLHDMAIDAKPGREVVVAVNTRFNCVSVIDGYFNFTPIWQPPFITELTGDDRCHLNGMAFHDGKLRYVTALGATTEPGAWRETMATGGILMEVSSGKVITANLSMPHSPRLFDGVLYVLEGGKGLLLKVDPQTGQTTQIAKLPGFTHGLAHHRGILFVGLSKLREKRGPQGLPIEEESDSLIAGVAAVEAASGRLLGILEFITGVDEIFDLHVLPGVRRGEILSPQQWFERPSIATMKGAFWENERPDESEGDDPLTVETQTASATQIEAMKGNPGS